jgi:hypothetical protein
VLNLDKLDVLFLDEPWPNTGVMGSADALEWFDFEAITNRPVPCRFIYLNFWDDGSGTAAPAIREILWEEK